MHWSGKSRVMYILATIFTKYNSFHIFEALTKSSLFLSEILMITFKAYLRCITKSIKDAKINNQNSLTIKVLVRTKEAFQ